MSDLSDAILALNPVRYGRCDELTSGVFIDSSTFAQHGTHQPGAIFGLPSGIETDPASTSIGGPVGTFPAAGGGEADLKGNFTWLFWIFYDASSPSGIVLCRRGQHGLSHSVQAGINEDHIFADITLEGAGSGDYFPLVSPLTLVDQTWYFGAVVRNDTNARLYVNADLGLGDERSDLTSADVDYNVEGTPWFIGRSVNTTAFSATRSDEVALIDGAVTEAEVVSVWEAAINAINLAGVSNVLVTSIADGSEDPDPVQFAFRHNWTEDLIERISFKTVISQALSGPEEARQVRPRPRREIEINQLLRDNSERRALRAKLWANQHAKWFIPILEDREIINSLDSGATEIPVSTLHKDYEIGSFVQIRQLNEFGEITQLETIEISAFDADTVEPLTQVQNDYEGHVEVCPARRGIVRISSPRGHTAEVEDLVITARLLAEDEKVIPNRITAFTPEFSYLDYEVFKESAWQSNDWSEQREYEIERSLTDVDFESGIFGVETDTPGAQEAFSYRIWIKGRELNASFLGWFYERAGSLNYLWVPSMQRDFEPLAVDGNDVTVKDHYYSENYGLAAARRDVVFVYNDGSMVFRRVTAFDLDGINEVLTLSGSAGSLTNLRSLSLLKFCRLDADTLEIAKRTDDVWIYVWRFRELLSSPE